MKIGIILPGGVDRGGEERVIPAFLALIERLARDHDVHVFVFHQEPHPARWLLRGAHIHNIGNRSGAGTLRGSNAWLRTRCILTILRENKAAPFSILQALFSGTCGQVAALAATWLRIPYAVHIAGGELVALDDIAYGGHQRLRSRLGEAWVLRRAAFVSGASQPIIDSLRALRVEAARIPLGVDTDRWPARSARARNDGTLRLVHVASLNLVKDQATLLRALARLAERGVAFELRVIGVDTLGGRIQSLAAQLCIAGCVEFMGFRTQSALRPLLAEADLLVMASRHEAGPLVLLEAAIMGVPAVGTAVGHFAEWSPDAALAVAPGDAEGLANAIATLAANEPQRLRIATEAQRRALAEDADATAEAFLDRYASLTQARGKGR